MPPANRLPLLSNASSGSPASSWRPCSGEAAPSVEVSLGYPGIFDGVHDSPRSREKARLIQPPPRSTSHESFQLETTRLGLVGSMATVGSLPWRNAPPSLESVSPSPGVSGAVLVDVSEHSWIARSVPPS